MKNHVTGSSIASYNHLKSTPVMAECQRKILNAMQPGVIYTRKQIAKITGLETSSVAGRVNELITAEYIVFAGAVVCPIGKKTVQGIKLAGQQKVLF